MTRISTTLLAVVALAALIVLAAIELQPSMAQAPAASGVVALTGARIIDGTGRAPIQQGTVILNKGVIEAVGTAAGVKIPNGATRVDLSGKTIIPGLINAHAHLNFDQATKRPVRDDLILRLKTYATYGVTSTVSLGSRPVNDMTPDIYGALVDESKKKGLRTFVHVFYTKDAKSAVEKGTDVLAHSIRDKDVDSEFAAELKRKNIGYIPTLTRDLSVFVYETRPAFFDEPFFRRGIALYGSEVDQLIIPANQQKIRNDKQAQAIKPALAQANRNLKILSDAGVPIAMGTDSGAEGNPGRWQGYFEHVEMEMMVKAGMTPMQVIVASTGGAARVTKVDPKIGTIEPGKWADLLVLNANPLDDIRNTRQIHSVWVGGNRIAGN